MEQGGVKALRLNHARGAQGAVRRPLGLDQREHGKRGRRQGPRGSGNQVTRGLTGSRSKRNGETWQVISRRVM